MIEFKWFLSISQSYIKNILKGIDSNIFKTS
jgi:hypothetical protein